MDTGQLEAFERIVREGGFGQAAWSLGISQPAISARIRTLEREVGGKLFTRSGRRPALTPLGETFLPYARRVVAVITEGVEAAQAVQEGHRGWVALGVLESLAAGLLAPAVARFHASYPATHLFVRSGDHESVVEMFRDGVVDLALVTWPGYELPGAGRQPLLRFKEAILPVVGANHPLAGAEVSLGQLVRQAKPFLLMAWMQQSYDVQFAAMEPDAPVLELPLHTVRALLLRGIGAAFMARTAVADELETGRLVEVAVVDAPPLARDSALFGAAGRALSPATRNFVDILSEEAEVVQERLRRRVRS